MPGTVVAHERGLPTVLVGAAGAVAAAVSSVLLMLGYISSVNKSHLQDQLGNKVVIVFNGPAIALLIAAALFGRLISLTVQSNFSRALTSSWNSYENRRQLLLFVAATQLPVALRDSSLGVLGLLGWLTPHRLFSLAGSPLDPFAFGSCVMFFTWCRRARPELDGWGFWATIVGFASFTYMLKLVLLFLSFAGGQ